MGFERALLGRLPTRRGPSSGAFTPGLTPALDAQQSRRALPAASGALHSPAAVPGTGKAKPGHSAGWASPGLPGQAYLITRMQPTSSCMR